MSSENKTQMCNCKQVEKKLICLLEDNSNLLQMIRDLRRENGRLESELKRLGSAGTGSRPVGTGTSDNNNTSEVQSLIDINHGWKTDYEELQMRYEMLSGEKRLLEDEERELKERVSELEKRQGPLESEITRLATALYKHGQDGYRDEQDYEILKTQITVYEEDFERERRDREKIHEEKEKIHEEKEKLKDELREAEEIIKRLTTELDTCTADENRRKMERTYVNGAAATVPYLNGAAATAVRPVRHNVQHPFSSPVMSADEYRWRLEQHRRGILPRNPPPTSFFYGGDVEVDRCGS